MATRGSVCLLCALTATGALFGAVLAAAPPAAAASFGVECIVGDRAARCGPDGEDPQPLRFADDPLPASPRAVDPLRVWLRSAVDGSGAQFLFEPVESSGERSAAAR